MGKNEIQRCEVTLLSHRPSNCTGKHPSLPVLEHSTILLSSYMFLDLPLWGCSVEIRTSPEKEPTKWSREMHMHHSCQVHSHPTQSPPHLRPSKQLYLSNWNKQITGEELHWRQYLPGHAPAGQWALQVHSVVLLCWAGSTNPGGWCHLLYLTAAAGRYSSQWDQEVTTKWRGIFEEWRRGEEEIFEMTIGLKVAIFLW